MMTQTLPMTGELSHRTRRAILFSVGALSALAMLGTALTPYLLTEHPLVLLGLNPGGRNLMLVANRVDAFPAVVVGSLRRGLGFVSVYALACLYGQSAIEWVQARGGWAQRALSVVQRAYNRLGVWLVLLVPFSFVAAFAGLARLRWRHFVMAIIPGQIVVVFVGLYLGETTRAWTDPVVDFAAARTLEMTGAFVVAVVAQQLLVRWRTNARGAVRQRFVAARD